MNDLNHDSLTKLRVRKVMAAFSGGRGIVKLIDTLAGEDRGTDWQEANSLAGQLYDVMFRMAKGSDGV